MEIKVLGKGCPKCKRLENLAREEAADLAIDTTITKVKEMDQILAYDVMMTPGLVIDGEVKSAGRVPRREEIRSWIEESAARS